MMAMQLQGIKLSAYEVQDCHGNRLLITGLGAHPEPYDGCVIEAYKDGHYAGGRGVYRNLWPQDGDPAAERMVTSHARADCLGPASVRRRTNILDDDEHVPEIYYCRAHLESLGWDPLYLSELFRYLFQALSGQANARLVRPPAPAGGEVQARKDLWRSY
jgi:hypothetical protein